MASRGRVSLWACASNSDSVRSAQSAAHTASTRLAFHTQGFSHRRTRLCCQLTDPDARDKCGCGPLDARRVRPLVYTPV
jgi:hypothetical protein